MLRKVTHFFFNISSSYTSNNTFKIIFLSRTKGFIVSPDMLSFFCLNVLPPSHSFRVNEMPLLYSIITYPFIIFFTFTLITLYCICYLLVCNLKPAMFIVLTVVYLVLAQELGM